MHQAMLPLAGLAAAALLGAPAASAFEYNTFDGPGFPSCYNVSRVHDATSVEDMQAVVREAAESGHLVRAAGKGHMWYDTQCADDWTVIVRTENVAGIYDFELGARDLPFEADAVVAVIPSD